MNYYNQALVILQRRKYQLEKELKESESKLELWSKRVQIAIEKDDNNLVNGALEQREIYFENVKSIKSQIEHISIEYTKINEKKVKNSYAQDSQFINLVAPKPPIFEIEEAEDLEKNEILEEIKAIKYSLQTAINRLEKLEDRVLKSNIKSNEETITGEIIAEESEKVDRELEELRRQLRE